MSAPRFTGWQALTSDQYHSIKEAIGSSSLKVIVSESPREYKHQLSAPQESKSAFDLGHAMHSVVLEQSTNTFKCGPEVSSKSTNVWKDAKKEAEAEGKLLLDPDQYATVLRGFDAFCEHPTAHKLVSQCQKIEASGFYEDEKTGLWLKFRPDGYCANDTLGDYIFDYKTTRSLSKRDCDNAILNYGYHISAAHYIAGIKALTGRAIKDYYLCFQKSSGSMDVRIIRLSDSDLMLGMEIREKALEMIAECTLKEYWPGVSDVIESSDIPGWAHEKSVEFLTKEVV